MAHAPYDHGPPGFPDKVGYLHDGYAVRFRGMVQRPRWKEKGPALAALELLQSGYVKEDPEEDDRNKDGLRWEIGHAPDSVSRDPNDKP